MQFFGYELFPLDISLVFDLNFRLFDRLRVDFVCFDEFFSFGSTSISETKVTLLRIRMS